MGTGASNERERPSSAASGPIQGGGGMLARKQVLLVNNGRVHPSAVSQKKQKQQQQQQLPRVSSAPVGGNGYRANGAAGTAINPTTMASLQKINQRKRRAEESGVEDEMKTLTRNADPGTLQVLQLLQTVEAIPDTRPAEKLRTLQQCYPLLSQVPAERFDQLAVMVYQKEGEVYEQQGDTTHAKDTYSRAITLAEMRVARGDKDMYMILKRYVMSMVGMARIWYEQERDTKGFNFVDPRHPRVPAVDPDADTASDASSSISSLESSFSSAGSVFSLNQAILRSMAPRPPRRRTGPLFQRVRVRAPHEVTNAQINREDEFVLHSKMTRELIASPCELLLLRCLEVVEIGHNSQSELLIPALIELAQIYEDLHLYSRALLLVRRCVGILCNVYDYDHPWVIELMQRADQLAALQEEQLRNEMATKIQSVWRMYRAMLDLEDALGRPVHRHLWVPREVRRTPDIDFLGDYVDAMPDAADGNEEEEYGALPVDDDDNYGGAAYPGPAYQPQLFDSYDDDDEESPGRGYPPPNRENGDGRRGVAPPPARGAQPPPRDHNGEKEEEDEEEYNEGAGPQQRPQRQQPYRGGEEEPREGSDYPDTDAGAPKPRPREPAAAPYEVVPGDEVPGEHFTEPRDRHGFVSPDHGGEDTTEGGDVSPERAGGRGPAGPLVTAPVLYNPVQNEGEVTTFTTMVPNARVIGSTQDTETDTHVQQTEYGDVLTIRTTTVTKTITEKIVGDGDDDEEEDENDKKSDEREEQRRPQEGARPAEHHVEKVENEESHSESTSGTSSSSSSSSSDSVDRRGPPTHRSSRVRGPHQHHPPPSSHPNAEDLYPATVQNLPPPEMVEELFPDSATPRDVIPPTRDETARTPLEDLVDENSPNAPLPFANPPEDDDDEEEEVAPQRQMPHPPPRRVLTLPASPPQVTSVTRPVLPPVHRHSAPQPAVPPDAQAPRSSGDQTSRLSSTRPGPPQPQRITRDYTVEKRRVIRTYHEDDTSSSEEGDADGKKKPKKTVNGHTKGSLNSDSPSLPEEEEDEYYEEDYGGFNPDTDHNGVENGMNEDDYDDSPIGSGHIPRRRSTNGSAANTTSHSSPSGSRKQSSNPPPPLGQDPEGTGEFVSSSTRRVSRRSKDGDVEKVVTRTVTRRSVDSGVPQHQQRTSQLGSLPDIAHTPGSSMNSRNRRGFASREL